MTPSVTVLHDKEQPTEGFSTCFLPLMRDTRSCLLQAHATALLLNEAYDTLMDDARRSAYERDWRYAAEAGYAGYTGQARSRWAGPQGMDQAFFVDEMTCVGEWHMGSGHQVQPSIYEFFLHPIRSTDAFLLQDELQCNEFCGPFKGTVIFIVYVRCTGWAFISSSLSPAPSILQAVVTVPLSPPTLSTSMTTMRPPACTHSGATTCLPSRYHLGRTGGVTVH